MIKLYVWEYPLGDEMQYDFARVDSYDKDTDPYEDEESPDPTRIIWVSESVYRAFVNASVVKQSLQDSLLREAEIWKDLPL